MAAVRHQPMRLWPRTVHDTYNPDSGLTVHDPWIRWMLERMDYVEPSTGMSNDMRWAMNLVGCWNQYMLESGYPFVITESELRGLKQWESLLP